MHGNPDDMATEPVEVMPPSHNRILVIMAVLGLASAVLTAGFYSARFGLGLLIGSALAFGNCYWLKRSLQRVFAEAAASDEGEKPKISALRYILRYLAMAAVIAVIYASGILPIVAVILGLGGFGFAVVIDGIIRIFQGSGNAEA